MPDGAQVYLQRKGDVEVAAYGVGFYGKVRPGSFEEEFFSLGTSPVDYEFHLEEREAASGSRIDLEVTMQPANEE